MSINYLPLIAPVTREEVLRFKRESRMNGEPWAHSAIISTVLSGIVIAFIAIVGLGVFVSTLPVTIAAITSGSAAGLPFALFPLVFLAIGGVALYRFIAAASGRWESLLRRSRFASANNLVYVPVARRPAYPGLIFTIGDGRETRDNYRSTGEPRFDMGNYRYTTGSGKEKKTHDWGYLALKLERRLPHMVLDARGNNGLFGASTLPTSFRSSQKLSLEGDFDKHFTLYCPQQYERDALYVFTPDLMALLIDESSAFDVEIVDDWMFVYSVQPFALDKPAPVNRLLRIIDTVGAKTLRQTDRYADERIGDRSVNLVAPQGQRLKRGPTLAGLSVLVMFAWVAFSFARTWF